MNLYEFLQHESFQKHKFGIEKIEREFIDKGCEKFLWRKSSDEIDSLRMTEKFIQESGELSENKNIQVFLKQFDEVDWNKEVAFIYPDNYAPNFFIMRDLIKKEVHRDIIINNIFDDDDTINHLLIIPKEKTEIISILHHLIYSGYMSDNYGGYKLFGEGLLQYFDILEYKNVVLQASGIIVHFQGWNTRRDTDPFKILKARKSNEMLIRLGYFKDELEIFRQWRDVLLPFFQNWYKITEIIARSVQNDWRIIKSEIESRLVAESIIQSKWKSEQTLFQLVRKEYPNAIFQYRAEWLEPQNLDIFISELNIGIEYQGIQHYQSIDFFGGEEGFKHRLELDKLKKKKCYDNSVNLIEWEYYLDINKKNLNEKIKAIINQQ